MEGRSGPETGALDRFDRHRVTVEGTLRCELGPEVDGVSVHRLIGVEPKDPVPAAVFERFVAGSGEVVVPVPLDDSGTELACQRDRSVGRARVVDHDLVNQTGRRGENQGKLILLVLHDHAQRDEHHSSSSAEMTGLMARQSLY